MSNENIFSALGKYNSGMGENYLTESFVFVINALLKQEHSIGLEILTQLCMKDNEFLFDGDEDISIITQESTDEGIPDIKISSNDKLIYVEVKDSSPVSSRQLKNYRKDLESSRYAIRRLILLTRFPTELSEHKGIPDKCIRWFEVYNWLVGAKAKVQDPVTGYLMESFMSFLEVKQMSIQKVGWEYIEGVPAFFNLINMIEASIKNVGISFHRNLPRAAAWDWKGFWLENKKYWCGIYYNNPLVVVFKAFDKKSLDVKRVKIPSYPIKEAARSIWFQLPLEDILFFSLDKDKQLEALTKFVKTSYEEAQKMRLKDK